MSTIKTAISIDESLFRKAEELAEELQISRSLLYARAVEEFVRGHERNQILRELNEVYGEEMEAQDLGFLQRARQHMEKRPKDEW
jgi:metal-responsive CopG/Arc/MetJ family transcriptional regulator